MDFLVFLGQFTTALTGIVGTLTLSGRILTYSSISITVTGRHCVIAAIAVGYLSGFTIEACIRLRDSAILNDGNCENRAPRFALGNCLRAIYH